MLGTAGNVSLGIGVLGPPSQTIGVRQNGYSARKAVVIRRGGVSADDQLASRFEFSALVTVAGMTIVTDTQHGRGLAIVHDAEAHPFCAEGGKGATLPAKKDVAGATAASG